MARYRDTRKRTGTGTKVLVGAAAGAAAALLARRALDKRYGKVKLSRSSLMLDDDCDVLAMCPQTCDDDNRLIYQVPIMTNAVLRANLGDSCRARRVSFDLWCRPVGDFADANFDTDAYVLSQPWRARAMLCKQRNLGAVPTTAPQVFPDPFNTTDWVDYPAMKRWEMVNMYAPDYFGGPPQGQAALRPDRRCAMWKISYRSQKLVLSEDDDLVLWITYGGMGMQENTDCSTHAPTIAAAKMGFWTWGHSQCTFED